MLFLVAPTDDNISNSENEKKNDFVNNSKESDFEILFSFFFQMLKANDNSFSNNTKYNIFEPNLPPLQN